MATSRPLTAARLHVTSAGPASTTRCPTRVTTFPRRLQTHSPARCWNWHIFDHTLAECDVPDFPGRLDGVERSSLLYLPKQKVSVTRCHDSFFNKGSFIRRKRCNQMLSCGLSRSMLGCHARSSGRGEAFRQASSKSQLRIG